MRACEYNGCAAVAAATQDGSGDLLVLVLATSKLEELCTCGIPTIRNFSANFNKLKIRNAMQTCCALLGPMHVARLCGQPRQTHLLLAVIRFDLGVFA